MHRPVRVAIVVQQLWPGGAQRRLIRTANRLADCQGVEVGLFVRSVQPDQIRRKLSARIRYEEFHRRGWWDARLLWNLRRELSEFRPDVLQAWQVWDQLWCSLAAPVGARLLFSYWSSGLVDERARSPYPPRLYTYPRLFKGRASVHLFNSRRGIEVWSNLCGLPRERCRYLPNYLEISAPRQPSAGEREQVREELGFDPMLPLIITVGRPQLPIKGQDLLLSALPRVIGRRGPVNLMVVGDVIGRPEARRTLERLAAQLGIGERVRFAGWREDVDTLLTASDLFVLPSRSEGFLNALIEAIAQQIPVVATRVGEVEAILDGGRVGLLCESTAESLAEAIGAALEDHARRVNVARLAREHLAARYDPEHMMELHRQTYVEVAGLA